MPGTGTPQNPLDDGVVARSEGEAEEGQRQARPRPPEGDGGQEVDVIVVDAVVIVEAGVVVVVAAAAAATGAGEPVVVRLFPWQGSRSQQRCRRCVSSADAGRQGVPCNLAGPCFRGEGLYTALCRDCARLAGAPMETQVRNDYPAEREHVVSNPNSIRGIDTDTHSFLSKKSLMAWRAWSPGSGENAHAMSSLCGLSLIWRRKFAAFFVGTRPSM